jgi:hypothetical protein
MSRSRRTAARLALTAVLGCAAAGLGGCSIHEHTVGLGPNGIDEVSGRQYYLLFGLLRLNEVDSQRMAGNLTSYRVTTSWSFTDILLSPFLIFLTVSTRTVTVET